jgi:hypothetical protein
MSVRSEKFNNRAQFKTLCETGHANESNDGLRILARLIARAHLKVNGKHLTFGITHITI